MRSSLDWVIVEVCGGVGCMRGICRVREGVMMARQLTRLLSPKMVEVIGVDPAWYSLIMEQVRTA